MADRKRDSATGLRRRELLVAGAGTAAGALGPGAAATGARARGSGPKLYDVGVVGAGLAGLTAASAVHAAGRSVLVLEARDRVGGRNFDHRLGAGKVAELGGQWAGPGQDRVLALAKRLGVATFPTFSNGSNIYYADGERRTYTGDIPPAAPPALVELAKTIGTFNQMAASVAADEPWTAPQAGSWDQQTIQTWITDNLHTAEARNLAELAIRGVYGEEADQISLLDLLAAVTGVGGDFDTLTGSAQSIRFVGGPQQLSERLARRLGARMHLGLVLTAVEQRSHVTLHAAGASFACRQAILTVPKTLLGRIHFEPPLSPAHDQLLQRQPMGSVLKLNAIYRRPFWREDGLSGTATSETGPVRITYDNSPPDGRPGVLVGFMEGNDSRAFYGASRARRRAAALRSLARYFGPKALAPTGYVDMMWAAEPYTRGAYGSFNPPGVLTSLHDPFAHAFGRLHYASADAAAQWPGYMDGAIRSGERAAAQALAAL